MGNAGTAAFKAGSDQIFSRAAKLRAARKAYYNRNSKSRHDSDKQDPVYVEASRDRARNRYRIKAGIPIDAPLRTRATK